MFHSNVLNKIKIYVDIAYDTKLYASLRLLLRDFFFDSQEVEL